MNGNEGVQSLESVLAAQGIPQDHGAGANTPTMDADTLAALKASGFELSPTAAQQAQEANNEPAPEPAPVEPQETLGDLEIPEPDESALTMESLQEYSREYLDNDGSLTDQTRESIKSRHNLDDEALNTILEAIGSHQKVGADQTLAAAGYDRDTFEKAAAWSRQNETPEKIAERNRLLKGTDSFARELAVKDLISSANLVTEPTHGRADTAGAPPTKDFATLLTEAMKDPRYNMQNAQGDRFREQVYQQLERAKR